MFEMENQSKSISAVGHTLLNVKGSLQNISYLPEKILFLFFMVLLVN